MAGQGSAAKRHRQSERRRVRNRAIRSRVRSSIRSFLAAVEAKKQDSASEQLKKVTQLLDSASGKGVYHENTVARTKSRLTRKLNAMQ
ncbi:MAG: 30S ribosomal protein S20 [Spirochaetota bacterium]